MTHLDGNAAGGALREIFAVDLTAAVGQCTGCGTVAPVATALAYGPAPGLVLRCPNCDAVLIRMVSTPDRAWLDIRGLAYLQFVG
jgi:hypothetical protein